MKNKNKLTRFFATLRMTSKQAAFTLTELPEAGQYGSKQELSAMAKVEPEARQYAPSPLEGEGWGEGSKRRVAFTLAEVLITLGIIGIVAAMTVPTLMKNYQKKVFVARLQTIYSDMGQAIKLGQAEYGDVSGWDFSLSNREIFDKYLSAFKKQSIQPLSNIRQTVTYYQISGRPEESLGIFINPPNTDVVTLPSGANLFMMSSNHILYSPNPDSTAKGMVVDVNGFAKPNTFGKDVFLLVMFKDGSVKFHQWNDREGIVERTVEQLKDPSESPSYSYQCNKTGRGMWCGALIQASGWKIPDDYPW